MDLALLERHRKTAATRRGEVSYLEFGPEPTAATGTPVPVALFVHGVGTNAYLWRNVLAELAGGRSGEGAGERRCLAIDLPIHGRTPAPADGDASLAALADTVAAFCEALDLSDIDLVAHDTGGAVSQIFAARHPDRLRTFTLTNCDTHDNVPPPAFQPTVDLAKAGALAPSAPALLADITAARTAVFGRATSVRTSWTSTSSARTSSRCSARPKQRSRSSGAWRRSNPATCSRSSHCSAS